jgi:internalin A
MFIPTFIDLNMKLSHITLSSSKIRFLMTGMTMMLLLQPFLSSGASASPQQPKPKSFEAWCLQRKSVPAATRNTIDSLLIIAKTTNTIGSKECKLADRQLKTLTSINLTYNQISDLKPLAGLNNLTSLNLAHNQISDLKPLAGLNNLTSLSLDFNQIRDVKPLEKLTKLTDLSLFSNQISNVKPLAGLTSLTMLSVNVNKISDVKPLAGLTNLTFLDLRRNQISDVTLLGGLTKLTALYLGDNALGGEVCPVTPKSICSFF